MTINPWFIVAAIILALLAFTGTVGMQLAILGVTLGIFFGTLSLGRAKPGEATQTHPGH